MSYYLDSSGKVYRNNLNESAPNAFNPQPTVGYLEKLLAEGRAQAAKLAAKPRPATPVATPERRGSEVRAGHIAAHDRLKANGMSEHRLRDLFPRIYSLAPVARRGGVINGNIRLTR
jgi:hypothetical protein